MSELGDEYWVPEHVRAYLRAAWYSTRTLEDMEPHVREWDSWMRAVGEFYNYRGTDGFRRVYQVHRRSIMPAMRVCREWGSFLLDEKTVVRAFGLGTGAFALWMDVGRCLAKVRHYDARMMVPLSWDSEGVRKCAFVTRAFSKGGV